MFRFTFVQQKKLMSQKDRLNVATEENYFCATESFVVLTGERFKRNKT